MGRLFIFFVVVASVLQGCANYRQIELEDVQLGKIKMVALTKADVKVDLLVNNPTKATFHVMDVDGKVYKNGVMFAKISMFDEFPVPPGTPSAAAATLRIEIIDPLLALSSGLNLKSVKMEDFTADVGVLVKKGGMKRWFRRSDVPLEDILTDLKF